jgi:hypothetical protein
MEQYWGMQKITTHPLMGSGATTIGRAGQAASKITPRVSQMEDEKIKNIFFEPIPEEFRL